MSKAPDVPKTTALTADQRQILADAAEQGRRYAHPADKLINELIDAGLVEAHDVRGGGRYVTITETGRATLASP